MYNNAWQDHNLASGNSGIACGVHSPLVDTSAAEFRNWECDLVVSTSPQSLSRSADHGLSCGSCRLRPLSILHSRAPVPSMVGMMMRSVVPFTTLLEYIQ